ncbi:hypothetical protein A1O1_08783 [Capronia coronata CBS 617.96]|uniref:Mitochondrial inner membrane protease subunit 2 n=1 Tax=Capronia coronata CBS 617.96 TaxID=1182541 RepID=W9XDY5_9EURO|nr:uncharacterized protein A1O1_08783 [Capronia coronata CBS 617.96]EXJ78383.1 hypothetical protein A1O1_08783 [Capronia coronata CBS 617.96]
MPPTSRGLVILRLFQYASRTPVTQLRWATTSNKPRFGLPDKSQLEARKEQFEKYKSDVNKEAQAPGQERERDPTPEQDSSHGHDGESSENPRKPPFEFISPSVRRWIWRLFYIAPPVAFVLLEFPLEVMWVTGPSMSPLLNVNLSPELPQTSDAILVQKVMFENRPMFGLRLPKFELQRGQIIVFYAPHNPEKLAVKRVVGVPGDRVKPLPGYPGGDDPVVIPYNHIWVEGDANSREKSIDSNWYGPISQNLVIGFVTMVLSPWYSPSVIDWREHDYPAKVSGRVENDVVHAAKLDPDKTSMIEAFSNGLAARELAVIRRNRNELPRLMRDSQKFLKLRTMYAHARLELDQDNPDSKEVAQGIVDELEAAFEAVGLSKEGKTLPPVLRGSNHVADEHEDGNTEQSSKQKKLKDYLERQKKDAADVRNDSSELLTWGVA